MKKIISFLVAALIAGVVLAQSTGVNGGGPNGGGGGGATPGGATNAVQYNAGGGNLGGVSLTADQSLFGSAATPIATALVNCGDATHALAYSTSTHTYSCQAITAGGGGASVSSTIKASSTNRSSTTTYASDPDLTFGSQTAGNYLIDCYLIITAGSGTTPGMKVTFTTGAISTNSQITGYWAAQNETASPINNVNSLAAGVNSGSVPSALDVASVRVQSSFIQTGTGTIALQWAQNVSSSANLTVVSGSSCTLTKF